MPDEPTAGATPAAGAGATPPAAPGDPGAGPDPSSTDDRAAANHREALARIASERDALRTELKTLREKDLPEAERTSRRLAELEQSERTWQMERQDLRMEAQAIRVASKLDYYDAEDALGWLARHRDRVEFDDKGNPTNLEKLLRELAKENPRYLKAAAQPRGSAEGGTRGEAGGVIDMNAALRRAAGR